MKHLLIFLFVFPSLASAKTIFEPSLGLTTGSFKGAISGSNTITTGTEIEANYSTLGVGFRYGITRRYIHVTAAFEGHLVNLSTEQAGVESESKFQGNVGLGIGYEWNIPLRTYITLGVPFSSAEISYYFSEGFLFGLKYMRMEVDFAGADLNVNTFGLTLNFPFEFNYPDHWWRKTDWE